MVVRSIQWPFTYSLIGEGLLSCLVLFSYGRIFKPLYIYIYILEHYMCPISSRKPQEFRKEHFCGLLNRPQGIFPSVHYSPLHQYAELKLCSLHMAGDVEAHNVTWFACDRQLVSSAGPTLYFMSMFCSDCSNLKQTLSIEGLKHTRWSHVNVLLFP